MYKVCIETTYVGNGVRGENKGTTRKHLYESGSKKSFIQVS